MSEKEDMRAIVYPTLWSPIMVKGVPRDWVFVSLMSASMAMAIAGLFDLKLYPLYGLAAFVLMWAIGVVCAYFDPEFFSVILEKGQIGKTRSSGEEGGNEYIA